MPVRQFFDYTFQGVKMNKNWVEKTILVVVLAVMAFIVGPSIGLSFKNETWSFNQFPFNQPLSVLAAVLYTTVLFACVKLHRGLTPSVFAMPAVAGVALVAILLTYFVASTVMVSTEGLSLGSIEFGFRVMMTFETWMEAIVMGVLTSIVARVYNRDVEQMQSEGPMEIPISVRGS